MAKVFRTSELDHNPIIRIPTGIPDLDWMYGETDGVAGMPGGKLTVLAGQHGVGKTRLLVALATSMNRLGHTVLYQQGEVGCEQFATEKLNGYSSDSLLLTPETSIKEQIELIIQHRPGLIIIDSANAVDEYRGGLGAREIVDEYRKVIEPLNAHAIFISHLNASGKFKGRTELPHYVDIEMFLKKAPHMSSEYDDFTKDGEDGKNQIFLEIGSKNRFGDTDRGMLWEHREDGVYPLKKWSKSLAFNQALDRHQSITALEPGHPCWQDRGPKPSFWSRIWNAKIT